MEIIVFLTGVIAVLAIIFRPIVGIAAIILLNFFELSVGKIPILFNLTPVKLFGAITVFAYFIKATGSKEKPIFGDKHMRNALVAFYIITLSS